MKGYKDREAHRLFFLRSFICKGLTEEDAAGWAEKALVMAENGCTDEQIFAGLAFKERVREVAI